LAQPSGHGAAIICLTLQAESRNFFIESFKAGLLKRIAQKRNPNPAQKDKQLHRRHPWQGFPTGHAAKKQAHRPLIAQWLARVKHMRHAVDVTA